MQWTRDDKVAQTCINLNNNIYTCFHLAPVREFHFGKNWLAWMKDHARSGKMKASLQQTVSVSALNANYSPFQYFCNFLRYVT